jgi:hypothetical protein
MIDQPISFDLPKPWAGQSFTIERLGGLSFLVGPNGSGKSRFADSLKGALPNARLLGTDRLEGMSRGAMANYFGDHFAGGYQKSQFSMFHQAGSMGSGIDAFIILEERPDIRVIVEATLSSLFNRDITLEWDSGNLVPKARLVRTGDSYRMDRDECHGIRELLVLLTHLHNDESAFLIIDEPELNLHPACRAWHEQIRSRGGGGTALALRAGAGRAELRIVPSAGFFRWGHAPSSLWVAALFPAALRRPRLLNPLWTDYAL